jgi:hypothetical protein
MEKEFVDYETTLELKELGFDEPCFGHYIELKNPQEGLLQIGLSDNFLQAPTYSQAFRFFREKYDMFSHLDKNAYSKYYYDIHNRGEIFFDEEYFNTPEEAEIACLTKLIEIVKQK